MHVQKPKQELIGLVKDAIEGQPRVSPNGRTLIDDKPGIGHGDYVELQRQVLGDAYGTQAINDAIQYAVDPNAGLRTTQREHLRALEDGPRLEDPEPIEGRSRGELRREALETYSIGLLSKRHPHQQHALQKLDHMGITDAKPLTESFMISLDPSEWGDALDSDANFGRMKAAVEEVADFARSIYVDADGARGVPFKIIQLVPDQKGLDVQGDRLIVGVPTRFGKFRPESGEQLRDRWDSGDMFDFPKGKNGLMMRLGWKAANPAGFIRQGLARAVRETATRLIKRLNAAHGQSMNQPVEMTRTAVKQLVVDNVETNTQTQSGHGLRERALGRIEQMDKAELQSLLTEWRRGVASEDQQRAANESTIRRAVTQKRTTEINVDATFFAGNQHTIDVSAMAAFADHLDSSLDQYIPESDESYKVNIKAFAAMFFGDYVNVDASLMRSRMSGQQRVALTGASLDKAFAKVGQPL